MPQPILAYIVPLDPGARPDNELPPAGGGGEPPVAGWTPPGFHPSHPIVIPPDGLAPGVPSHPIYIPPIVGIPGFPTHPIVIPPGSISDGVPTHPIVIPPGIWGPTDPRPEHPIAKPPAGGGGGGGGEPPTVDNELPPVELPPMPDIGDGDQALVLVMGYGDHPPVWLVIDEGGSLKPNPWPEPKPAGAGGKRKK